MMGYNPARAYLVRPVLSFQRIGSGKADERCPYPLSRSGLNNPLEVSGLSRYPGALFDMLLDATVRDRLSRCLAQMSPSVVAAYLFGSASRGETTPLREETASPPNQ
jgi:hypothetical protein